MEQRIFNQPNTMYGDAMNASRIENKKLPFDGIRSFSGSQYGQRVTDIRRDFRSNNNQHVSNFSSDYLKNTNQRHMDRPSSLVSSDRSVESQLLKDDRSSNNIQTNTWKSLSSSSWSEWNPKISDLNSDSNYCRPSPEPDVRLECRTPRNERSPEIHFRTDSRGGTWRSSPERYQGNINSNSSFFQAANIPSLFDGNLRMQLEPASSVGRDVFTRRGNSTATSRLMETERTLGYRSTASSGLTELENSFRFEPPSYNLAGNGSGISNAFSGNKTNRLYTPAPGKNWFEQPGTNRTLGSGYMGSTRNLTRKRNIPFEMRNENEKKPKIEKFPTSLQRATGQISGASVTQLSATPARKKKKKKKKKPFWATQQAPKNKKKETENEPETVAQSPEVKVVKDLKTVPMDVKSTAVPSGTSGKFWATGQVARNKKRKARNKLKTVAQSPEVKVVKDLKTVPMDVKSTAVPSGTSGTFWARGKVSKNKKKKARNKPKTVAQSPEVKELKNLKNPRKRKFVKDLKYLYAISPRSYPMQKMTYDEIGLLKDGLVKEMEKLSDKSIIPHHASCYNLKGAVMVYWKNDYGMECLKKVVKTLKPWDGANLKVVRQGLHSFTWTVIVGKEFPNKGMTTEQITAVFEAIANKMDEVSDENLPNFIESHMARGIIMVAYTKQKDFEWLKNAIKDLQPWEGAQLRLVDIDDVPVYNKIELTLPFPVSDFDEFTLRLGRQNPGLDTSDWYLFSRRIKEEGRKLLVSVKNDVIKALEKIDYKPFLNLNRITVVNLGETKKNPFSVSEYEEMLKNLKKAKTHLIDETKRPKAPVAQTESADGDVGVVE